MRAFLKIQEEKPVKQVIGMRVKKILESKLISLFSNKLLNHKGSAFISIQTRAAKNKKLRKYDLAEIDGNEPMD